MLLEVRAEVHPTEDLDKIKEAIRKIFPDIALVLKENSVVGKLDGLDSLEKFKVQLRSQAIRDAARRTMQEGREDGSLSFMLNRQVATVGKVSFSDGETTLGPIIVSIKSKDLDRIVDFLTKH